jgi:capsular exopolysaccharide synthesis family protein
VAETPFIVTEARQYLGIVHKRRGLLLTCVGVSLIVATTYNYTTRPVYQASSQILIDRRALGALTATSDRLDMAELTDLATQLELLRGRNMAERVVEKLGLHKTEEFQQGPLMSPWERFQRKFLGAAPAPIVDSAGIPLSPAAAAFRSRLSLDPVPGSRLVNLRFRAYNARIARDAVNTLAQLYIEESMNLRSSASTEASGWLGDRIRDQQEKLKAAERALQEYREKEGLAPGEEREDLVMQRLNALNESITSARLERLQKEAVLNQMRSLPPGELDNLPIVLSSSAVQALRSRLSEQQRELARLAETLGDKHPDMIKTKSEIKITEDKLRVEVQAVSQALEGQIQALRQQEATLEESLELAKKDAVEVTKKSVEYGILKREIQTNQALLQDLMSRAGATDLESELRATNVRIVEKAELPRGPFSPDRIRNYQLALLIGFGLGIGLSILLERLDDTVKTPDDVKVDLGLPFLGMVPEVEVRSGAGSVQKLMSDNPQSSVAEAYRLLRTNLLFSSANGSGMVVVVSSANPGEGKTTTVANLAASLAQNGAKVLAIDADLRRPTLHQHFAIHKTPGLSDLIVGKCQASEAVQVTRFKGLHILPCGYVPPNPAELLGSTNMRSVLAALKTHYDWVIIDTPPILAMADTAVVSPFTDGLVLVASAESTGRPSIQRSIDQIRTIGGKLLGVVLNKVNLQRNSYYYGQYYGEYYRSYYAEGTSKRDKAGKSAKTARGA